MIKTSEILDIIQNVVDEHQPALIEEIKVAVKKKYGDELIVKELQNGTCKLTSGPKKNMFALDLILPLVEILRPVEKVKNHEKLS